MIELGRFARIGLALGGSAALAACAVIPKTPEVAPPTPQPTAVPLPTDTDRHRVALLVPLSGSSGAVGEDLANATTMALLDTNATKLRITTYDTTLGAPAAAARAVADGNRLILGPLQGEDALAVAQTARAAHVPVISFTNDAAVAGGDVFVMGAVPAQAVTRVVRYARAQGVVRFAALIPLGSYGERVANATIAAVKASGGALVAMESYDRSRGAITGAVRRLKAKGPYEAVLIGDTAGVAAAAAPLLKASAPGVHILGTELWDREAAVTKAPALNGAWFAAISDQRFGRFTESYKQRFGGAPYRMATLGYDSVLLTLRVARDWVPGAPFPTARLYDRGGFLGLDGIFRFNTNDVVERSLEVREVRGGVVRVINPAPTRFED
jgi:branched-chain amino acid transport system substrate-binding protein